MPKLSLERKKLPRGCQLKSGACGRERGRKIRPTKRSDGQSQPEIEWRDPEYDPIRLAEDESERAIGGVGDVTLYLGSAGH